MRMTIFQDGRQQGSVEKREMNTNNLYFPESVNKEVSK
jgi:hypothetical protein